MKKRKLLYLLPGPTPPTRDAKLDKFFALSDILEGDILQPVWWDSPEKVTEAFGADSFPTFKVGNFKYHFLLLEKYPRFLHFIVKILFFVTAGRKLSKSTGGYDYIMCYGTNSTGLGALAIKILCGGKLIVEIPGVPEDGSKFDSPDMDLIALLKQPVYNLLLRTICSRADHLKLLYDSQLDYYPSLDRIPSSVFHDFVATETLESLPTKDEGYILFLGYPWYRKGVDILIDAFNKLSSEFPTVKLKIVGWFPDREKLDKFSGGNTQIEILKPVPQSEALKLIAECKILALPSRSEAMGRVLLEAMAAGKPIVASRVNGIPTYIRDKENGLLFDSENSKDLHEKLFRLLSDEALAKGLALNAYKHQKKELNESAYVRKFNAMLDKMS